MLFPSAAGCPEDDRERKAETKGADWLENRSFTSQTAKKVIEFQRELNALQENLGLSENHDESNASVKTEQKYNKLDSDSSDDFDNRKSREKNEKRKDSVYEQASPGNHQPSLNYCNSSDKVNKHDKARRKRTENSSSDEERGTKETKIIDEQSKGKEKKKRRHRDSSFSDDEHRKRKKKKHSNKHKKHKREKSSVSAPTSRCELYTANAVFLEDLTMDIVQADAYRLDRKSDKNSWTYGSLYKQHIAQYRPFCFKCMGTRKGQEFYMKDKEKRKNQRNSRYFDRENSKLVKQAPLEVITTNSKVKSLDLKESQSNSDSVLRLEVSKGNDKHDGVDIRDKLLDPSTSLYIQGKSASYLGNDVPQREENSIPVLSASRKKTADYNRRLQESPNNIQLWLDFVKFQDTVYAEDESFGNSSAVGYVSKLTKAVIEKKISIMDKALQSNPGSIELILHKIELSSDLVDAAKINKELEQLLFVHSANTRLWRYYLNFNLSSISLFSVTRMIKLYHKCFKVLLGVLEGKVQTHSVPENLNKDLIDLLLDYCCFLNQSGHREKAAGTLQALVEYNILCPPALRNVAKESKMAAFEEFWESECPRVGHEGALGWDVWVANAGSKTLKNENGKDSLEELEEGIIEKKYQKSRSWLEIETLRETHHTLPWLPGEGQTDEDCEDADSIVVFDDISPILFDISSTQYLDFLVSMVAIDQSVSHFEYLNQHVKHKTVLEYIAQVPHLSCNHLWHGFTPTQTDLSSKILSQVIPHFSGDERTELTLLWIDISLKAICKNHSLSELNKSGKKEVRKLLKTVLKQELNRNNLYIWAVYIQIERQMGKPDEYRSIAETAIVMHSGTQVKWFLTEGVSKKKKEYVDGLVSLFVQYTNILLGIESSSLKLLPRWSALTLETKNKVKHVITCLLEGNKVDLNRCSEIPGSTLLRVLAKFPKAISDIMKFIQNSPERTGLVKKDLLGTCWCYSVFRYCTYGIESGLDVYTETLQSIHDLELVSNPDLKINLEERLLESKMRLILYHMTVSSSPLHILRENLDEVLMKFPTNSTFLALFINVEKKARISGRINKYFDRQSRYTRSPLPVVFAVCDLISLACEARDITAAGESFWNTASLLNRARSWLENYLNQSGNPHCPLIWRLYLQIEVLCKAESRSKGLFYRAIQRCPFNKNIYKDGIRVLGEDKLQEVVDLMIEKELRVHLPVEELDILIE